MLGRNIDNLTENVEKLYKEIRSASTTEAYSLVVAGGRKLLMHIAVGLGAEENKNFVEYVTYLQKANYTPPNSRDWVGKIKEMGNEVNHQLIISSRENAETMLKFLELLMVFNYEFADIKPEESESSSAV